MQKLFKHILIPVTFNRSTLWSVHKAVQLANKFYCDITLLYVKPLSVIPFFHGGVLPSSFTGNAGDGILKKMKALEKVFRPKLADGLRMNGLVQECDWFSALKDVIIAENIDLVVIPRGRQRLVRPFIERMNINKLSQQSNCTILTVTRQFNVNNLQSIVIPVENLLPVKKLSIATYVSLETNSHIYLVGNEGSKDSLSKGYLLKAYQLLNEFGHLNVHCAVREKPVAGYTILSYAKNVKAGLIVVNAGKEARLKGWWNSLLNRQISAESTIPVLTVAF